MTRSRRSSVACAVMLASLFTGASVRADGEGPGGRSSEDAARELERAAAELARRAAALRAASGGHAGPAPAVAQAAPAGVPPPAPVEPVPMTADQIQSATQEALQKAAIASARATMTPTQAPVLRDRYGRRLRPALSVGGGGRSADGAQSFALNDSGGSWGGIGSRMDTAPGEAHVTASVDLLMRSNHMLPVRDHSTNFLELDFSDYTMRRPEGVRLHPFAAGDGGDTEEKDSKVVGFNPDLYMSINMSGGRDAQLRDLERGQYDPKQKGFYNRATKLELPFAVQGWVGRLAGEYVERDVDGANDKAHLEKAHVSYGGDPCDLYRVDAAHPYRFTVGYYKTDFGFYNSIEQYLSEWTWLDAPVIAVRTMGAPMIGTGAQLELALPVSWTSTLIVGAQNGSDANMTSFIGAAGWDLAGHPAATATDFSLSNLVYTGRLVNGGHVFDCDTTIGLGLSASFGPNATGGDTWLYGADLLASHEWCGGRRWILWQTEAMRRDAHLDPTAKGAIAFPRAFVRDDGIYSQLLFGFRLGVPCPQGDQFQQLDVGALAFGVRWERSTGEGNSANADTAAAVSRNADPLRDDRRRIALIGTWQPGAGAGDVLSHVGLTVQYNFDRAEHLGKDVHSVFIGLQLTGQ